MDRFVPREPVLDLVTVATPCCFQRLEKQLVVGDTVDRFGPYNGFHCVKCGWFWTARAYRKSRRITQVFIDWNPVEFTGPAIH